MNGRGKVISIAGPPAAGKTTVAHWVSRSLAAELVLEDYAGNPFLAEGYRGRNDLRLAGQTWFLLSRVGQLGLTRRGGEATIVSDYAFLQDRIYANVWLEGEELALYERLASAVTPLIRPADLIIHLDGPVELLLDRIARRGRDFEARFSADFLRRLSRDYNDALASASVPVISINVAEHDLIQPGEQRWLMEELARHGAGV